jgi:hypothetical protein
MLEKTKQFCFIFAQMPKFVYHFHEKPFCLEKQLLRLKVSKGIIKISPFLSCLRVLIIKLNYYYKNGNFIT